MGKRKEHHVVPNPQGGWSVKKGGGKRSIKNFDRKSDAEKLSRGVSRNQETELIIHDRHGRIRRSDSHGHDPNHPRDKS